MEVLVSFAYLYFRSSPRQTRIKKDLPHRKMASRFRLKSPTSEYLEQRRNSDPAPRLEYVFCMRS
jgi:hypothetical protein